MVNTQSVNKINENVPSARIKITILTLNKLFKVTIKSVIILSKNMNIMNV